MDYRVLRFKGDSPTEHDWLESDPVRLVDATNGGEIEDFCEARILWNDKNLFVRFDCIDRHIWGTHTQDDDPIYNEEVVELFIAKGESTPKEYFEFQFSPNGVKFDAKISNPTGDRNDDGFVVDKSWDCENLEFSQRFEIDQANENFKSGRWVTYVQIPAEMFGGAKEGDTFRANLFRIDGWPEQESFQSWMPTMKSPADFHVPSVFGKLSLE